MTVASELLTLYQTHDLTSLSVLLIDSAAAKYNVSAMPTFIFLKSGEVVDRLMGANPARLQELIDELK